MAAASRENGRKSKGPVTEQGKAVSQANAGKHWGRAEDLRELVWALGESPAEYDRMRDAFYQSLRPTDSFEEMLVDDMADIHWRPRRMIRGEAGAQGKRRRDRKMREEEMEAPFEAGKFHDLVPQTGLRGVERLSGEIPPHSRVAESSLRPGAMRGISGRSGGDLKRLYGYNPSDRAQN